MRMVIEGDPGEHIESVAVRMVQVAPSVCRFNGIELLCDVGATPAGIVEEFERRLRERNEAFWASPAGKAETARREKERASAQAVADALVAELDKLDFGDMDAVIGWIERACDPFDHAGVMVQREIIVSRFAVRGYRPGVNVGEAFDGENRENVARYIIGQGLDGIRRGWGPHPILRTFAERWRSKFSARDALGGYRSCA